MNTTLNDRIRTARTFLDQQKGRKSSISQQIKDDRKERLDIKKDLHKHEKALEIVKEVGRKTQEKIQYHISEITSLAMEAVFDDPYELVVSFVDRRDQNECDLLFERDGEQIKPVDASGVGAIDVASFALRIAAWSMNRPRTRNTIILDEPFKYLDKTKQEKASEMIKQISKKLGIQFIIVTHEDKLTEAADKVFQVSKKGKISKVEEL